RIIGIDKELVSLFLNSNFWKSIGIASIYPIQFSQFIFPQFFDKGGIRFTISSFVKRIPFFPGLFGCPRAISNRNKTWKDHFFETLVCRYLFCPQGAFYPE